MHLQASFFNQFFQRITSKFQQPSINTKQDHYRYAPSSIYSIESFIEEDNNNKEKSVFEKTYVSFPEFSPSVSNRDLFTMPEVMTTTATPSFYSKPHFKPIWIA
jgi:hypothetical protein